jgi:Uma2 family endonuclease
MSFAEIITVPEGRQRMTLDDFLLWSSRQSTGRFELVDGEVVAVASESGGHNLVKLAMAMALRDAAAAAGFAGTVFTDGMTVRITEYQGREPDAAVACTPVADKSSKIIPDPLIVCEVVSPSSEQTDTTTKLMEYFSVPTIEHYLVVSIEPLGVIHYRRGPEGLLLTQIAKSGTLRFDPPGLILDVAPILAAAG